MPLIENLIDAGYLKSRKIIDAFRAIKRRDFLPDGLPYRDSIAELDEAVSIGWAQTISQPAVVAFMLELLDPQPGVDAWRSVSTGLAFSGDHNVYVSEGNTGRISLFDSHDERRRVIDINQGGFHDSFTGDLAFDFARNILYAADPANHRVAVIDGRTRLVVASVPVGRLPFAMALSPDRQKLYVTSVGMLTYALLPGADPVQTRSTGLPFPAFGFPSAEASQGAARQRTAGTVKVPGLGDPNAPESNSVAVLDVSQPGAALSQSPQPVSQALT